MNHHDDPKRALHKAIWLPCWELSLATFTILFRIAPKLRTMHFVTDFVVITTFIMSIDLNADALVLTVFSHKLVSNS